MVDGTKCWTYGHIKGCKIKSEVIFQKFGATVIEVIIVKWLDASRTDIHGGYSLCRSHFDGS